MTTAASPAALLETHFGALKDPRSPSQIEHKLIDILIITICATICGANDWEAIAEYGRTKQDWLKTWLELPNGIPSPDTFSRVLARIKPTELQKCFMGWMSAVAEVTEGELLNIDGKTLRGAKESGNAKSLIHMVSVWSASQHLVLGQTKVSEKSNEITAIPPLLEMLAIRGCLVSIDAMGCQTEIAQTIVEQGADYVLALKGNQGDLHTDVAQLFTAARKQEFRNIEHQFHSTVSKGHVSNDSDIGEWRQRLALSLRSIDSCRDNLRSIVKSIAGLGSSCVTKSCHLTNDSTFNPRAERCRPAN